MQNCISRRLLQPAKIQLALFWAKGEYGGVLRVYFQKIKASGQEMQIWSIFEKKNRNFENLSINFCQRTHIEHFSIPPLSYEIK